MDKNQKINCTVTTCEYNNDEDEICELKEILIEPCENMHNGEAEDESMCGSYSAIDFEEE